MPVDTILAAAIERLEQENRLLQTELRQRTEEKEALAQRVQALQSDINIRKEQHARSLARVLGFK